VTGVALATVPAVIVKVAKVEPGATVTDAGTLAAVEFELASETTAPPVGAPAVRVTVPVPDWPLAKELRAVTLLRTALRRVAGGLTVTAADVLTPE